MTHILSLGAVNKQTGEYVYPKIANKKDEYVCPDCNNDLILCQGKIVRPYFKHKVERINPCHHYSNPTETQIHKDGKMLLKTVLERKIPISFARNCTCCKKNEEFEIPEISETSNIQLEYRFEYNGLKIADIAYIDNSELLCIFEICNTHKTSSENRPEPWFEVDAETLIKIANNKDLTSLHIPCIRRENCDDCIKKEQKIKLNIRKDIESKSCFNESSCYQCYSEEIANILINIICGIDTYKQWAECYQLDDKISQYDYNEGFNLGICEKVYYSDRAIRDIQNMHLYKYLQKLDVDKGKPEFTFHSLQIDVMKGTFGIENKLRILCQILFGTNPDYCKFILIPTLFRF